MSAAASSKSLTKKSSASSSSSSSGVVHEQHAQDHGSNSRQRSSSRRSSTSHDIEAISTKQQHGTIRSPLDVARHTAAQASSEIATIELPYKEWPELRILKT
jgi:hypothetical protein